MKKTILSKRFLHSVLLTLAFCLFPVLPACAQEDIVDRLDKALGVTLPSEYKSKLKTFVQSSLVFKDKDASELTEQFIKDEMKKDWGISKQSQLLFIWTALNEKINGEFLYEGSDGNENRLEEFASIMNTYDDCGKRYETAFRAHTKQRSEEANQRSAEAKQRSAEAVQTSNMITYYGLYQITSYYQLRGVAPESETTEPNEFWKHVKEYWEHVANNCEKFNIDYRSLLPLEVQKFYGIQPTRQNNLTCEKAMNQTLNYTIKELAKLYNLYQQAPQAEREIDKKSANYIIEDCKKRNIDYRAILLKELGDKKKVDDLLKLFGVE
ncbi:MAG: hypothetical protein IJT11_00415 [Bacteroidaceae bacterium]|nr:hypothetical protein [Bacteroidaceae bacterium]